MRVLTSVLGVNMPIKQFGQTGTWQTTCGRTGQVGIDFDNLGELTIDRKTNRAVPSAGPVGCRCASGLRAPGRLSFDLVLDPG